MCCTQVRESSDIPVVLVGNKYDLVNGMYINIYLFLPTLSIPV